jgi:nucleoside-diphosphate-sugar epimerase/2-polyprenyl-3-methyl-5-hydroxy-6-metoxy-1,4-benzoquinol methylase
MSYISIIGSQGYIGSFLAKNLRKENYIVKGFDKSKYKYNKHEDEITKDAAEITYKDLENSNIVIYLAGLTGRKDCENVEKSVIYKENIENIINIAKKLNQNQIFIFATTAALLENNIDTTVDENNQKIQEDIFDNYTFSMLMREKEIKKEIAQNNIKAKCIGLRFGTVIGLSPCQRTDLVIISLLRSCLLRGRMKINNSKMYRGILWNYDLLRVIHTIINNSNNIEQSKIYTISSYNSTIAQIANNIASKTNCIIDWDKDDENNKGFICKTDNFCKDFNFEFQGDFNTIYEDLNTDLSKIILGKENYSLEFKNERGFENNCRLCKSTELLSVLDLGMQPLANNFLKEEKIQEEFPLHLTKCKLCHHLQLNYTVQPEKMFENYLYASSTSKTLNDYFEWIANKFNNNITNNEKIIVELASNDGSQLDHFKKLGWKTIGIDPSKNLCEIASTKGHTIYNGFWGQDHFSLPSNISMIMGQNVIAHVPEPVKFLQECVKVANENTLIVFQTSQCDMLLTGEFDTVYHEHLSYFTAHSWLKIAEISNLNIIDFEKTPIHGNSFLVTMIKNSSIKPNHCESFNNFLKNEEINHFKIDAYYLQYREKAYTLKKWLNSQLNHYKLENYNIIAYGAAAKGMTLLNFLKPEVKLDFILDDASLKQDTFSPGLNIPVKKTKELLSYDNQPFVIIILAWNFFEEIINKIKSLRNNSKQKTLILVPFPVQKIIDISNQLIYENTIKQFPLKYYKN